MPGGVGTHWLKKGINQRCHSGEMKTSETFFFFFIFLFYDNFTYMSNMFFQLLAWQADGMKLGMTFLGLHF